jgi:hypothetical protein
MSDSILTSTKKILGIADDYTAFDLDIISHINSVFSTLNQLGIGPAEGFMIEDKSITWDAFLGADLRLNAVKQYVYLRVRMVFDPPGTSYAVAAMQEQIKEHEWRLNVVREDDQWTDPDPETVTSDD